MAVAQMLNLYGYPQISYGATDSILSDRRQYPYFYRTVQGDEVQYTAILKLLKYLGCNWVGIITTGDDSGERTLQYLTRETPKYGICIEFSIYVTKEGKFTDYINIIQKSTTEIIIICGSFSAKYMTLLKKASATDINKTLILPASWSHLNNNLKNIHYKDSTGSDIYFDDKGELPVNYDIINQIIPLDGKQKEKIPNQVGTFDSTLPDNQQMHIEICNITWKNYRMPRLRCTEMCHPGFRKALREGFHICCYDCIPCSEGEFSNVSDSEDCFKCPENEWPDQQKTKCIPKILEFLSYETDVLALVFCVTSIFSVLITTVTVVIFFSFRDTPIVKANNRNLSFVLLGFLKLSFLCVFLFIGRPLDITCMIRHISFGMAFSAALSCVLAKTIMVCIAFKATKPGSTWRNWMGLKVSNAVVLVGSSGQVLISVIWLLLSPPFQELDMHTFTGKIIVQCNEGSVLAFFCMLGYMGLLAAVSFFLAFMVRTLPDNFNEAKHITFSMLVFCSVWVCAIPAYLSSKGKNMVAVEIFATLASSLGIVSCIYLPKCYIILFKADLNTKRHLLGKTFL
ncbi:extracellular calcium-sensing receptor-like [Spea bombifrons]|uniref:extracellular calcium-sensing receptor-like n=1 Tax=Spea bombifrons TaxID=233779 RepID=UPI00234B88E1|nr:extracellular calcium-sensing receptor-like [Spea bombifrons]